MSRTLQKLAHRRQSEELEREGHGDFDMDDDNADAQDGHASSGRNAQRPVQTIPVSLVPSENGTKASDDNTPGGSDETLNAILIQPSTLSPSKNQKLYKNQANSILEEDEDEDQEQNGQNGHEGEDGQSKLVKEGAYLKSRLWWFGLLLIATGEGGESDRFNQGDKAYESRQLPVVWVCTCQCGRSPWDCRKS